MAERALSPRTVEEYQLALARAFRENTIDVDHLKKKQVNEWSNSAKNQLRCAVRWWRKQQKLPPKDVLLEDAISFEYEVKKRVFTPSEYEIEQLEKVANTLPPPERAAVLLLLYLGLRAEEFYALPRRIIERAVSPAGGNTLTFVRKGGKEASLDISRVQGLLDDLLLIPARQEPGAMGRPRKWEKVGEIYSSGQPKSQYQIIRRIVRSTFEKAGMKPMSPHNLRHAFATRLNRDGASPFIIQAALNHSSIQTTQRYVHAATSDVAKFMRGPKEERRK